MNTESDNQSSIADLEETKDEEEVGEDSDESDDQDYFGVSEETKGIVSKIKFAKYDRQAKYPIALTQIKVICDSFTLSLSDDTV